MAGLDDDVRPPASAVWYLRPFARVQPDELRLTLALFGIVFLLLVSFYVGKPVRESWLAVSVIGDLSAIEVRAVSGALQSAVLIGLLPLYARLYARFSRRRLLLRVNLFFAALFPVFFLFQPGLLAAQIPGAGVAFYVFIGVFAVTVVAQFWVYAADLYAPDAGARLFPLIALGASAGGVAGSLLSRWLVADDVLPTFALLFVAPLPLLLAAFMLYRVERFDAAHGKTPEVVPDTPAEDSRSAWVIIRANRYLVLIALFVFLLNWVQTNGENILFAAIQNAVDARAGLDPDSLGLPLPAPLAVAPTPAPTDALADAARLEVTLRTYSNIYAWVSLVGLVLQAFVVSRLIRFGGMAGMLLIPPFVSLVSNTAMSGAGGAGALSVLTVAKTAENATNVSIANTARHILWLPVAREALYKAKTAIDTVGVRIADGLAAATVIVGTRVFAADVKAFFTFNLVLVVIWLVVGVLILRERRARQSQWSERERTPS